MDVVAKRVAAAAVMVPVAVALVLALPTWAFAIAFALLAALGACEWPRLATLTGGWRVLFWVGAALLAAAVAGAALGAAPGMVPIVTLAMAYWLLALVWVIQAERGRRPFGLERMEVRALAGWATLVPAWASLVSLHGIGPLLVLALLVLIWLADSAAFFAGRRFGRRRLAARVSPGKSWEGVLAGLGAVAVAAWLAAESGVLAVSGAGALVALSVGAAAVSVLGDLTESLFKRRAGVKDSGSLIPGHGGVLDRIDSLTAAAPAFLLGWIALGLDPP